MSGNAKFYKDTADDMPVFSDVEWDKETNKVISVGKGRLEEYAKKQTDMFWFRYRGGSADVVGNSVPLDWGHELVGFVARNDTKFYSRFLDVTYETTLKKGDICLALENMYTIPYRHITGVM